MRAACRVAADALRYAGTVIQPGITTDELDERVHNFIVDAGAYPSPLGYAGFPKSICTSINEVLCHGIPDRYGFGDIFSVARAACTFLSFSSQPSHWAAVDVVAVPNERCALHCMHLSYCNFHYFELLFQ